MKTAIKKKDTKKSTRVRRNSSLPLQRVVSQLALGNSYVQRICVCPCDGGCPRCVAAIQPKLTIGQPGDQYEQEADCVANNVMRMVNSQARRFPDVEQGKEVMAKPQIGKLTSFIQRQADVPEDAERQFWLSLGKQPHYRVLERRKRTPMAIQTGIQAADEVLWTAEAIVKEMEMRTFLKAKFGEDKDLSITSIVKTGQHTAYRKMDAVPAGTTTWEELAAAAVHVGFWVHAEGVTLYGTFWPLSPDATGAHFDLYLIKKELGDFPLPPATETLEKESTTIQTKAASDYGTKVSTDMEASLDLESHINSLKGGGQPLSKSERDFFESRFGYDFSQVWVHNDSRASEAAKAINARAFTVGRDMFFGSGQYMPETDRGKRLLSHEFTHVVQQNTSLGPRLQRFTAERDGDKVFLIPEKGDTDRDLDRVLCAEVKNRRIAGRTRIDVTECLSKGTIKAMSLGAYNCAEFVRQAIGQTRPPSITNADWLITWKLWQELLKKGFQVRSFGTVNKEGKIEPVKSLTWKQLNPQMGDLIFMMGDVGLLKGHVEPDPKGDNFVVSWDHVGIFIVRSRSGSDYHLAKDGDENPIDLYHTGMEPGEWLLPGAYLKATETLLAYLSVLAPEEEAAQERYIPRKMSRQYWGLSKAERRQINQETDRRFSEETGVARRLNRNDPKDQRLHWIWLRIRDEVTAQHLEQAGASHR